MKKFLMMLGVTGVLSVGAAFAQPAATPPAGAPATTPPPVDTTVTSTTTTTDVVGAETYGTMPATGGAPIAMALGGALTAAGAFFMRRKLS